MLNAKFQSLHDRLAEKLPSKRLFHDELNTLVKGTDASIYRLIPELVARVESMEEMQHCIDVCREMKIGLTFKAGATSLSGQTVTDSLLLELGRGWDAWKIFDEGKRIRLQPGMVGEAVNTVLKPYGRKFPPAPASIAAAKVGGIVANNASGNSYGIAYNSYNCNRGMRIHFSDGSMLDTREGYEEIREKWAADHRELLKGISSIRERILSHENLAEKIRSKYRLKNTTGYGMNSFVDFEDPVQIVQQLMIGSEGTLGFISEIDFETVEEAPLHAAALLFFPDLERAGEAVPLIRELPVLAAELMDRAALKAVEDVHGMPAILKDLQGDETAILIDTSAYTEQDLQQQIDVIEAAMKELQLSRDSSFTTDPHEYDTLWKVRKGLFTSASAARRPGTAVVIEDLVFPMAVLGKALKEIQGMFTRYNYDDSVIWGHVMDGNFHFVIMQDFSDAEELDKYKKFMHELTDIVVEKYSGSLKGEHGTGRNMAPFVEKEWGAGIYAMMKELKTLLDPHNIFNPGVLINEDPEIYVKNLKKIPAVNPLIDKCIECGFCEDNCPSKDLTLTPRQRITAYRELSMRPYPNSEMARLFNYAGEETCATDGLCALACPVDINTGILIKELRFNENSSGAKQMAAKIAENMDRITATGRFGLNIVHGIHRVIGSRFMGLVSRKIHKLSRHRIPLWNPNMPKGAGPLPTVETVTEREKVVYFPTCINRTMGNSAEYAEKQGLMEASVSLMRKGGFEPVYPEGLPNLCCGMAFSSKGFREQAAVKENELNNALLKASENGRYPVLVDMSPCLLHMRESLDPRLKLYEAVEFIHDFLLDRIKFTKKPGSITIHNTCSTTKMGLQDKFLRVAEALAEEVIVPQKTGCCGWAGDRGFTYPELNASALQDLKSELPEYVREGYSNSRTCEIGLSLHSGISYKSIVYLADEMCEKVPVSD